MKASGDFKLKIKSLKLDDDSEVEGIYEPDAIIDPSYANIYMPKADFTNFAQLHKKYF